MALHLDVGASLIMAIVFLSSTLILTCIAALLYASRPNLKRNGLHNLDLEQAQSEPQMQHMQFQPRKSLIHRPFPIRFKPPHIHCRIPIPSKPLTSSLSSTGPPAPLTPTLVSIGPSHFSAAEKLPLDPLKEEYLQHCLRRLVQNKQHLDFEAKMKGVKEFIWRRKKFICQCYDGYDSKCKDGYDKDFEANVMKDAFFIIELFLRELNPSEHSDDQLLSYQKNRNGVREDLVLMTNVLPYFFLRDLYGSVFDSAAGNPSFDSLTQNYISKLPLITGNQEGVVDSCCSGFSHCVEDCSRNLFYCFWTRHLTTGCNSSDSNGHHVAISTTNDPIFQFTNLFRDRVVNGNTLRQGSTPSSSTGNRPLRQESNSSSPAGMIGVNSSAGPSSSASRGEGPIHEGSTPSSSTGNRPLRQESNSSSPAGMIGVNSSAGPSSSASRGEGPIHEGSTPSSSTGNRPLRQESNSSSPAGMIGVNSSAGPSSSASRGEGPIHEGLTPSSSTGNRPLRQESNSSSPAGMIGVNSSTGPSSSASRGEEPIHEGSTPSSSTGNRPLREESSSSSSAGMIGVDSSSGPSSSSSTPSSSSTRNRSLHERSSSSTTDAKRDLGGDSFSSSGENRPLYKGFSPSSVTGKRRAREMEFIEFVPNGGSISSSSSGKRKIDKESSFSSKRGDRFTVLHSATKLQQVGVKLKAAFDDGCMINIKFENGILSIPPLELYDYTERTLGNLIAYEQRALSEQAYISSYIKFMESLVKTEDDAGLLIDKDIIVNAMAGGDKEVKELLQRLCKDIILPGYPDPQNENSVADVLNICVKVGSLEWQS